MAGKLEFHQDFPTASFQIWPATARASDSLIWSPGAARSLWYYHRAAQKAAVATALEERARESENAVEELLQRVEEAHGRAALAAEQAMRYYKYDELRRELNRLVTLGQSALPDMAASQRVRRVRALTSWARQWLSDANLDVKHFDELADTRNNCVLKQSWLPGIRKSLVEYRRRLAEFALDFDKLGDHMEGKYPAELELPVLPKHLMKPGSRLEPWWPFKPPLDASRKHTKGGLLMYPIPQHRPASAAQFL